MMTAQNARRSARTLIAAALCGVSTLAALPCAAGPTVKPGQPGEPANKKPLRNEDIQTPYPIPAQSPIANIGPSGEITRAATQMTYLDGLVSDSKGNVYFADRGGDKVHRLDAESGKVEVFIESIDSPAGMAMADDDTLVVAQSAPHVVTRVEVKTKATTPVVEAFADEAKKSEQMVRPNDLALDAYGGAYVSDAGGRPEMFGEMPPHAAVYYVVKNAEGATVKTRIIEDINAPSGIALSADGKTLYVLPVGASALYAYDVSEPGKVGNKREFCKLMAAGASKGVRGGDGMTIDSKGNLYLVLPNALSVQIVSPEGETLGHVRFSEKVFGVCFGGKEHKTLYVSAKNTLYAVPMEAAGRQAEKH